MSSEGKRNILFLFTVTFTLGILRTCGSTRPTQLTVPSGFKTYRKSGIFNKASMDGEDSGKDDHFGQLILGRNFQTKYRSYGAIKVDGLRGNSLAPHTSLLNITHSEMRKTQNNSNRINDSTEPPKLVSENPDSRKNDSVSGRDSQHISDTQSLSSDGESSLNLSQNTKRNNDSGALKSRLESLNNDSGYQSDTSEQAGFTGHLPFSADVGGLPTAYMLQAAESKPLVLCGHESVTLMANKSEYDYLKVDGVGDAPLYLSELPSSCGHTLKMMPRNLVLKTPYNGCFVIRKGDKYIMPLLWWESPVNISCPVEVPSPPASPLPFPPLHLFHPPVICSLFGMNLNIEGGLGAAMKLKIQLRGKKVPFLSSQCGYRVIGNPGQPIIHVPYNECEMKLKDGMHVLSIFSGKIEKIFTCHLPLISSPPFSHSVVPIYGYYHPPTAHTIPPHKVPLYPPVPDSFYNYDHSSYTYPRADLLANLAGPVSTKHTHLPPGYHPYSAVNPDLHLHPSAGGSSLPLSFPPFDSNLHQMAFPVCSPLGPMPCISPFPFRHHHDSLSPLPHHARDPLLQYLHDPLSSLLQHHHDPLSPLPHQPHHHHDLHSPLPHDPYDPRSHPHHHHDPLSPLPRDPLAPFTLPHLPRHHHDIPSSLPHDLQSPLPHDPYDPHPHQHDPFSPLPRAPLSPFTLPHQPHHHHDIPSRLPHDLHSPLHHDPYDPRSHTHHHDPLSPLPRDPLAPFTLPHLPRHHHDIPSSLPHDLQSPLPHDPYDPRPHHHDPFSPLPRAPLSPFTLPHQPHHHHDIPSPLPHDPLSPLPHDPYDPRSHPHHHHPHSPLPHGPLAPFTLPHQPHHHGPHSPFSHQPHHHGPHTPLPHQPHHHHDPLAAFPLPHATASPSSYIPFPTSTTLSSPLLNCTSQMTVTLLSAVPGTVQVKGPDNMWRPISSAHPDCFFRFQAMGVKGVILSSPLSPCHAHTLSPFLIALPIKFIDADLGRNRILELQCPYYSPTSTSPTTHSGQTPQMKVFCSEHSMSVELSPGPEYALLVQGPATGQGGAQRHCVYSATKGANGTNMLIVPFSSCHVSVQGNKRNIFVKFRTLSGQEGEVPLTCLIIPPLKKEGCEISDDLRLPCGHGLGSLAECQSLGCCYCTLTHACYYPMEECTIDRHMVFTVPASLTDPPLSTSSLFTPGNDTCFPQKATPGFALFKIPLDGCGVHKYEVGHTKIYMVEILNILYAITLNYGTITRDSPVRLMVECRYSPNSHVSVSYLVKTPSLGPSIQAQGVFGVQLRIATDETYSDYYPQYHRPLSRLLGQPLYLEVRLLSPPDSNVTLLVHYCLAYPRSARAAWVLNYDGCPNQLDTTGYLPTSTPSPLSHIRRFTIRTFQFLDSDMSYSDEEIYFMCSTEVCSRSEGRLCIEGCVQETSWGSKKKWKERFSRNLAPTVEFKPTSLPCVMRPHLVCEDEDHYPWRSRWPNNIQ